jgi:hypothetical protein
MRLTNNREPLLSVAGKRCVSDTAKRRVSER